MKCIKKIFNNRPWKEIKTRKIALCISVFVVIVYTIIVLICAINDVEIDSALTDNVFDFFKWLVATGCIITVAKVAKGNTSSDEECDNEGEE